MRARAPQVTQKDVERELARARGALRLLPWAGLSALGGAGIGLVAGGGPRAAGALLAVGLVFALFLWVTSVARCPACGAPLPRGEGRIAACRRCGARFV